VVRALAAKHPSFGGGQVLVISNLLEFLACYVMVLASKMWTFNGFSSGCGNKYCLSYFTSNKIELYYVSCYFCG